MEVNKDKVLGKWELIEATNKELKTKTFKLQNYINRGYKNVTSTKLYIHKKNLEIIKLRSILKYLLNP